MGEKGNALPGGDPASEATPMQRRVGKPVEPKVDVPAEGRVSKIEAITVRQ